MSLVLILLLIVLFIVVATAHFKLNPFLALLCAAFIAAFAYGLPLRDIEATIRGGFGNIMGNIGLVIVLGTLIGVILERTGAAITMAQSIIRLLGERFPLLTMPLVGYMVAIPVLCDSGFCDSEQSETFVVALITGVTRGNDSGLVDRFVCHTHIGATDTGADCSRRKSGLG